MVKEILTAVGIPFRRSRFMSPPAGNYAVYFDDVERDGADPVSTSGGRLPGVYNHNIRIELYEPRPDDDIETAIEAVLDAYGLPWAKEDRYWIKDERVYQVLYEFSYTTK